MTKELRLVVDGRSVARGAIGADSNLVFAGHLRDVGKLDGELLAILGGANLFLLTEAILPGLDSNKSFDRDFVIDEAGDFGGSRDIELVLDEDGIGELQIAQGDIAAGGRAARIATGDGMQPKSEIGEVTGRNLRREITRRVGPLGAIGHQENAGQALAGFAANDFLQSVADRGLGTGGLLGQLEGLAVELDRFGVSIEGIDFDLDLFLERGQLGCRFAEVGFQVLPTGFIARSVGDLHAARQSSIKSTSVLEWRCVVL